jgi:hypothetical protein
MSWLTAGDTIGFVATPPNQFADDAVTSSAIFNALSVPGKARAPA